MSSGSVAINALTAPDAYTAASTIEGVALDRINLDVANQAIYWQLKLAVGGGVGGAWSSVELYMAPGSRSLLGRQAVGIRVRAAVPLASLPAGVNQAVVTVEGVLR